MKGSELLGWYTRDDGACVLLHRRISGPLAGGHVLEVHRGKADGKRRAGSRMLIALSSPYAAKDAYARIVAQGVVVRPWS